VQSDTVHAIEGLNERLDTLGDTATRLTTLRDRLKDELRSTEGEVEQLTTRVTALNKVGELFRALMDKLVDQQVRAVESVVTEGLKTIFFDQDLSFEAEVGPKYNKIAVDFYIRQGAKEDPIAIRGRPLDSFGGGPSSISSLVLRVLTLLRLKRQPILALDESLGAVSEEYVDHTGRFLRQMAEDLNIDVLLVTHKTSFTEHATRAYRCQEVVEEDGSRKLSLKAA